MKQIIIPEVIKNKIPSNSNQNNLNITLNKIDRRDYSANHESYVTNNNNNITNNNSNKGGLLRFIFDLISLPFKIISKFIKHIFSKYNLKYKFNAEIISIQKDRLKRKMLKKQRNIWNNDEIF